MDEPIYVIPVTPPEESVDWARPTHRLPLTEDAATPVYSLDGSVPPSVDTATTKVYSLDEYTSPGRRAAAPQPIAPQVARAESRLTPEQRAALGNADPDLIAALEEVVMRNASDLHVTAGAPPSIRVDGGLRPIEGAPRWMPEKVSKALYSLLLPDQRERFEREQELDFAYTAGGARFRVNFYQQRDSVGGAFRLIPREIKPLEQLGVPASIGKFAGLARGLVLVTGPTGSGKSTTLAAIIDLVNRTRADHIMTVEDPIEFLHRHQKSLVNQREVGHDTHSFANALKHVLRQDPDVILIGELRDLETISVALTAAETGHLVFATLHTQSAAQTIDRVIDVFPPHQQGQVRAQLAATLQGVVCQTLVKKASGKGRVVATEVLVTTPAIGNLIREGKTYQITSMMQAGRGLGMHTMDQHLAELVDAGQITREAALEKAQEPDAIGQLIQRSESPSDDIGRAIASGGIDFGDSYSREKR
ncbi:type IV pilus twitching motility protein PilT [Cryobacterium cheniae]|uniref:Type IV pilus twitching motility protein PilT n=2 Tax=Cryobacterium cheniae TaxID=1259262 RepID=A0A4R8XSX9_9MICO|nr:type IV pilus twitching motility protein PilT [Cryobacterium cheniae]